MTAHPATDASEPSLLSHSAGDRSGGAGAAPSAAWLQRRTTFVLLCMLGALPLVVTAMPPLTDLPGHLGRYAVQVDGGTSATLRQWYGYRWSLIPNLGVDLLVQVLAPSMGLEPALKLITVTIPVLQIAGWLSLARVVHGHVPVTALFALPLAYGYPFQFGFVNFTLGAALATCFLALWIGLADRAGEGRSRIAVRWAIFAPVSCILWVTHLSGWAIFCVFAIADEFRRHRSWRWRPATVAAPAFRRDALRSAGLLSCLLVPWACKLLWPSAHVDRGDTSEFFAIGNKAAYLAMALRDRWAAWDIASAIVVLAVLGWSWTSHGFARGRGLALGTGCLALLFLLIPGQMLGSHYADMRLVPTMLALGLIAARPRATGDRRLVRGLATAGLIFAGARLAGNVVSMAAFDRQFSADLAVLRAVPRHSQLISLSVEPCEQTWWPWRRERRIHLGGYAIERYHDFSNDQWIIPGGQLLQVHNPDVGGFASDPSEIAKDGRCGDQPDLVQAVRRIPATVRFLWIILDGRPRPLRGWHPIARSGGSVVYARDRAA